jgi:hypothetical protein
MANGKTYTSIIAVGKSGNVYRAVEVLKVGERYEVSRCFRCIEEGKNMSQLTANLVSAGWGRGQLAEGKTTPVVAVFDGNSVVFRHIEVPAKTGKELDIIIRIQAEAILPLPPEEMGLGWREGKARGGKIPVTIAATRNSGIKSFADEASILGPARIVLECDGLVRAWREACRGTDKKTMIIRLRSRITDVCLAEDGLLVQATRVDVGMDELFVGQTISNTGAERLKQDIEGAIETFGSGKETAICIISDGTANVASVAKYLADGGMAVQLSSPKGWVAEDGTEMPSAELCQYLPEIGAAMLAIDNTTELNVFGALYHPKSQHEEKPEGMPWRKAAIIIGAAAVLTVAMWYGMDKLALWRSQALLNEKRDGLTVVSMLEQHKAINETAGERPDILEIFALLRETAPADVLFHNFIFRKGKPVSITGQAGSNDSLYKFEAALRAQKGIANVKEQSAVKDDKENKIVFTVTFDYRAFTKSRAEPLAGFGR